MLKTALIGILNSKVKRSIKDMSIQTFLFLLITVFYFTIWVLNPSNYIVLFSFFLLFFLINLKVKNFRLSLIITIIASGIVESGKTYAVQLIPPSVYDSLVFPNGYVIPIVVKPILIFSFIEMVLFLRDVLKYNISSLFFNSTNIFFILFLISIFVSDFFGSRKPNLSTIFDLSTISTFLLFFYLQGRIKYTTKFLSIILALFSSFIVFESTISFQQFIAKAPIGKTIEVQQNIEYTGDTADELQLQYTYRPDGTFDHANSLGMNLVFWMLLLLIIYLKNNDERILYVLFMGIISLVLTLSRSAWLGSLISFSYIIFYTRKLKILRNTMNQRKFLLPLFFVAVPLFVFFIFPRLEKSLYVFNGGGGDLRLNQIKSTWEIILAHPLFGVGTNMLVVEGLEYLPDSIFGVAALDVHNWYLSHIANHGIPSFLIFMSFILLSTKKIFYKMNLDKLKILNYPLELWYISSIITFFVIGLFSANNGIFFVLSSLAILNRKTNV